jgi:O-antigen ligase
MDIISRVERISLYVFLFTVPFEMWLPFGADENYSVSRLAGFVYFATLLPRLLWFFKTNRIQSFLLPIWLFFGLMTLVSLYNINPLSDWFFHSSMFQCMILFWVLVNHERQDRLILEKGMLCFALGMAVLAVLFSVGVGFQYIEGRAVIFGENQNVIGTKMSIALIVLLLAIIQNRLGLRPTTRVLLILPIPVMMRALAETGSRVAFISFGAAFIVGVLLFRTKKVWGKVAAFVVGVGASIPVWQFLMESETMATRLALTAEKGDLSGRDAIWEALVPLVKSNPIFGVGLSGLEHFSKIHMLTQPHNVFLEVMCYTGVVGLALYLTYMYRVVKQSYQLYKADGILLPMLLLSPVFGLLLSGQILEVKIGWVIFAYIVGSSILKTAKKNINYSNPASASKNSLRKRPFGSRMRSMRIG